MNANPATGSKGDSVREQVCMIAYTNYPADGRVRLEAESLVAWGYDVVFLVPKQGAKPRTYELEGVTVKELNVRKIRDNSKIRYVLSYLAFLGVAFFACTYLFLRKKVRIIHVHNMPDVLVFAAVVPRLFGCKLILDVHDTVLETYEAKFEKTSRLLLALLRLEERICCFMADRVICVNHVQREAVIRRGIPERKIATVITMPRFVSSPRPVQQPNQERVFRLVNHGTMSKRLGNDLILEAAARLVREIPGFELHIIGGGENLEQLFALTRSLGIEQCVHFHAGVPWDQLPAKLGSMDVGIVANRINSATALMLPSKLIDYAVLGIPAIVPRLKAIEHYFSEDMVTYFEPENIDSMVAATLRLHKDAARRERQAQCAKNFVTQYRWNGPANDLRGLYASLLESRPTVERPTRGKPGLTMSRDTARQDEVGS